MDYKNILLSIAECVATLTFNRPKVLNALDSITLDELDHALTVVEDNTDVKALILTGAGEKAFIAGADISQFPSLTGLEGKKFARKGQQLFDRIENFHIPVIAAVNGFALGGGLEVALACHMRILSDNAVIGLPEVSLGIIPGYGGTQRLPRLIGKGRALELILTGRKVKAEEALNLGIANQVVPAGEAVSAALELAKKIMRNGPVAVSLALEAVNQGVNLPMNEAQHLEASLFGNACATDDMKEGATAFLEKRSPDFQGK